MRWFGFLLICLVCVSGWAAEIDGADEDEEEEQVLLAAEDIPASIVDTEVGDWAQYTMHDGSSLRLTVVERWTEHGDDHLIVRSETGKRGRRRRDADTDANEERVSVKERVADLRDLGPDDFVFATTLLVDRRSIDAVVVNYVEDGRVVRQSYFSDEVPVYGLVRGVLLEGGKRTVVINLKSFGYAEGGD